MRSYEVPAVGVVLAGVTSLRALVDVPAPGPGGVLGVAWLHSGALSLVQIGQDTVLSLVEPYYAGAKVKGLCHNNTPQGK